MPDPQMDRSAQDGAQCHGDIPSGEKKSTKSDGTSNVPLSSSHLSHLDPSNCRRGDSFHPLQLPTFQPSNASSSSWSQISSYGSPHQSNLVQVGQDQNSIAHGVQLHPVFHQQYSSSFNLPLSTGHLAMPNEFPAGSSTAGFPANMANTQAAMANISSETPYPSIETDVDSTDSSLEERDAYSDSSAISDESDVGEDAEDLEGGGVDFSASEQSDLDWDDASSENEEYLQDPSLVHDRADLAAANGVPSLENIQNMPFPRKRKRKTGHRGKGGWNKGQKTGPRAGEEPDEAFITTQNEAMKAFIDDQDNEKALRLILQAISSNPEVYSAHALLSEIFFAMGENQKAVDALVRGAYATTDRDVWQGVADTLLTLTTIDRRQALRQAVQCFSRIINLDNDSHEARFQRGAAHRELGAFGRAVKDFDIVLQALPYNTSVLRQMVGIYQDKGHSDHAKRLCEDCVQYYKGRTEDDGDNNEYSWPDALLYADLFARLNQYDEAISKLKELSRWLLGREKETYWDLVVEDDREWDAEDEPRRAEVTAYQPGIMPIESYGRGLPLAVRVKLGFYRLQQGHTTRNEALSHFMWLDPDDVDEDAPIFYHTDLFRETADILKSAKEHSEALRYYEALKEIGSFPTDSSFWLNFAATSYVCGNRHQAVEAYEVAKAVDSECMEARIQLGKLYTDLRDRTKALQHAHEALEIAHRRMPETNRRRYEKRGNKEARKAAERVLKQARKLPVPKLARRPLDPNNLQADWQKQMEEQLKQADIQNRRNRHRDIAKARVTKQAAKHTSEQSRTERVQQLYYNIEDITPGMRNGSARARRVWLDCAQELIADFCSCSPLFPPERHMRFTGYDQKSRSENREKKWKKQAMKSPSRVSEQTEDAGEDYEKPSVPDNYRGILFSQWLDLFLETALIYATSKPGNKEACYAVLNAALNCVVWFHEQDSKVQIYMCYFTSALALHDVHTLTNKVGRWFISEYRFCTDSYRLFAALNLLHTYPDGRKQAPNGKPEFRDGPTQKFIFRQVRTLDSLLPDDYNIDGPEGPVPAFMRDFHVSLAGIDEDEGMSEAGSQVLQIAEGVIKPQEMDVVLLSVYGHLLYAGNSFPNALSYFYRALSLDPKNPMVLLSIALSYIHQLAKRQVEDRHMHLLNGLAVFEEYAIARMERAGGAGEPDEDKAKQEIAFNRARIWQMMALSDLAVKGYDEVLQNGIGTETSARDDEGEENWTKEAAFATANIFASNGDPETAREITEKWLVVG